MTGQVLYFGILLFKGISDAEKCRHETSTIQSPFVVPLFPRYKDHHSLCTCFDLLSLASSLGALIVSKYVASSIPDTSLGKFSVS